MRQKLILLLFICALGSSFTVWHKFYVSVTNINYVEKTDALQITSRIFIDDLDALLKERYGIDAELATPKESDLAEDFIKKYLKAKFVLELDGQVRPYNYIGKKYDDDLVIIYLEVPQVGFAKLSSISVENDILIDLYEEQKNLVHIKWQGNKKSFVLVRENAKGTLKFEKN